MRSARDLVRRYTTDLDGPLGQRAYRSLLRDARVAAWLGASLGVLFTVCFITGLYSHVQQHPLSWLPIPAAPAGLYRITQGIHVTAGIASMPVVVAKLWVVWPRFASLPPFRSLGDIVERLGILALVGGGIFMVFTGIANIAQWYPWHFSFTASHYWIAWVTIGAIIAHLGAKWAIAKRAWHSPLSEADPVLQTVAEAPHPGLSRRQFLGTVATASGALTIVTAGQTLPELRSLAILAPRKPDQQPINRSAANARVIPRATSPSYRLTMAGQVARPLSLTLTELVALSTANVHLPIACVEGWSYSARWTGIRLRDLLAMAGAAPAASVHVESLEQGSIYSISYVDEYQARASNTLLAMHLDGAPLSLDHGYPLRLIGPDRPGVNQTKWVTHLTVS